MKCLEPKPLSEVYSGLTGLEVSGGVLCRTERSAVRELYSRSLSIIYSQIKAANEQTLAGPSSESKQQNKARGGSKEHLGWWRGLNLQDPTMRTENSFFRSRPQMSEWLPFELNSGRVKTRVLISIKAAHPNYTSSSSLICNPNLSHSYHKQGITFSV